MFLGRLITRLPGEWIQSVRKGLAGGFLGQGLTVENSSAAGGPGSGGRDSGAPLQKLNTAQQARDKTVGAKSESGPGVGHQNLCAGEASAQHLGRQVVVDGHAAVIGHTLRHDGTVKRTARTAAADDGISIGNVDQRRKLARSHLVSNGLR